MSTSTAYVLSDQLRNWLTEHEQAIPEYFPKILRDFQWTSPDDITNNHEFIEQYSARLKKIHRHRFMKAIEALRQKATKRQVSTPTEASLIENCHSEDDMPDIAPVVLEKDLPPLDPHDELDLHQLVVEALNDILYPDGTKSEPSEVAKQRIESIKDIHLSSIKQLATKLHAVGKPLKSNRAQRWIPAKKSRSAKKVRWHISVKDTSMTASMSETALKQKRLIEKERLALFEAGLAAAKSDKWMCRQCGCANDQVSEKCRSCCESRIKPENKSLMKHIEYRSRSYAVASYSPSAPYGHKNPQSAVVGMNAVYDSNRFDLKKLTPHNKSLVVAKNYPSDAGGKFSSAHLTSGVSYDLYDERKAAYMNMASPLHAKRSTSDMDQEKRYDAARTTHNEALRSEKYRTDVCRKSTVGMTSRPYSSSNRDIEQRRNDRAAKQTDEYSLRSHSSGGSGFSLHNSRPHSGTSGVSNLKTMENTNRKIVADHRSDGFGCREMKSSTAGRSPQLGCGSARSTMRTEVATRSSSQYPTRPPPRQPYTPRSSSARPII